MKVCVVSPEPSWAVIYEAEVAKLRQALGELPFEVHHIGSTAILGIYAKPIIDILLVVQSLKSLDAKDQNMRELGYEPKGEFGIPERRYFRKDSTSGDRTHQIHSFVQGSAGAIRHLAFRDYMNCHNEAAREYSDLKQGLAASFPNDIQKYMNGKDAFIKQHEAAALAWNQRGGRDA